MVSNFLRRAFSGTVPDPPQIPRPVTTGRFVRIMLSSQWPRVLGGLASGIAWMLMLAILPIALGRAVDDGVRSESGSHVSLWVAVIVAIVLSEGVVWVIRHHSAMGLFERSFAWCCQLVFERVLDSQDGVESHVTPGDLVSLMASDARRVANMFDLVCRGGGAVVAFSFVVVAMTVVHWQLAFVALATIVPLVCWMLLCMRVLVRRNREMQHSLSQASSVAADMIGALRVVKGLSAEPRAVSAYEAHSDHIMRTSLLTLSIRARTFAVDICISGAVAAVVGWVGARYVANGAMSIGELVTFTGWSVFLVLPLLTFSELARKITIGTVCARRIVDVLNIEPAYVDADDAIDAIVERPTLSFRGVTLEIHGDVVVRDVSFDVTPGAPIAVVCDPSAAMAMMNALRRTGTVTSGAIEIGDVELARMTLRSLRAQMLVMDHDAVLISGSLRQNLELAAAGVSDEQMLDAMSLAAGADIVDAVPGGLDGSVTERGRSLSGGQRQRVGLARALLARHPVLVLDDPTSALDAFTEADAVDGLFRSRSGAATLVFTSSPTVLDAVTSVVLLGDDGSAIAQGAHGELLASHADYRKRFVMEGAA
jgi:ABC-type multidrug transport system fused ATPase/permease subunit